MTQSISLRNPLNPPNFRKGNETRNREYLTTPKKYTIRDSSDESPFATPYEPSLVSGSPDLSPIKFAQPRFFPPSDREDLGLESLMANNFSLAEEPHEVRARQRQEKRENETQSKIYAQWHGPVALLLLATSCTAWTSTPIPSLAAFWMHFRLGALCIAALVVLKSLVPAIRNDSDRSVSDIVLLTFELIATITLGATLRHRAVTSPLQDSIGPLETPGLCLIAIIGVQEVWMLYSRTRVPRTSNGGVPSPPIPQPAAAPDKADHRPFAGSTMSSTGHDINVGLGTSSIGQRLPVPTQRTTRSRTKLENNTRAQSGFSSLSLGGMSGNDEALGMKSLDLGQTQRRN